MWERALPAPEIDRPGDPQGPRKRRQELYPALLADLEASVSAACEGHDEWPAQVVSGIYVGIDFAIAHPTLADLITVWDTASESQYEGIVQRLARLMSAGAPEHSRLPGSTNEALVAGIVGLILDHLRIERFGALEQLRPDLVLVALLPYLGFEEARLWANKSAAEDEGD